MKTVVILDYGIGNVRSIYNAMKKVNANPVLTNKPELIRDADAVILPGVGAFAKGMENLKLHHLIEPIHEFTHSGKPFMGICLGMQMLLEESNEFGTTRGLGLIEGKVEQLKVNGLRLPHVSWNEIEVPSNHSWSNTILHDIRPASDMYFVHSFAAYPRNSKDVLSTTTYDAISYCSAVHKDNIYGVQFHPEKSAEYGLRILKNFVALN